MPNENECPICGETLRRVINKLIEDNRELRELVGKLQGLLNLRNDIKGNTNGQN